MGEFGQAGVEDLVLDAGEEQRVVGAAVGDLVSVGAVFAADEIVLGEPAQFVAGLARVISSARLSSSGATWRRRSAALKPWGCWMRKTARTVSRAMHRGLVRGSPATR